jgi:hypothetical protein
MTRRRGDESAGNDAICSYKVDAIGVESVREMEPFGAAIIRELHARRKLAANVFSPQKYPREILSVGKIIDQQERLYLPRTPIQHQITETIALMSL